MHRRREDWVFSLSSRDPFYFEPIVAVPPPFFWKKNSFGLQIHKLLDGFNKNLSELSRKRGFGADCRYGRLLNFTIFTFLCRGKSNTPG